jgi:hypothetical protein
MKALKLLTASLLMALICFLPLACGKEDPQFGPPKTKEQSVESLPRDHDGWITDKDLALWEKEPNDPTGNIVFTMEELKGMKLFMTKCNKCHPAGEKGKGPSLNDKKLPDFLIHFQIRNGLGDMPAFKEKDLSKEDVKRIILFVKLLRKNEKS